MPRELRDLFTTQKWAVQRKRSCTKSLVDHTGFECGLRPGTILRNSRFRRHNTIHFQWLSRLLRLLDAPCGGD